MPLYGRDRKLYGGVSRSQRKREREKERERERERVEWYLADAAIHALVVTYALRSK